MDPNDELLEILCPRCGEAFAGSDVTTIQRAPEGRGPARISISCPHCGGSIALDALTGREEDALEAFHRG